MILARLFRPKWQHPKAHVRRQALARLPERDAESQGILRRLAADDSDAEVRKAAIKRIDDLAFLRARAEQDDNAGVREVALARYRQLLAGGAETADFTARLAELESDGLDDSVLVYVARRGREPELRLAALERLQTVAVLEEIALHDQMPKVRLAAVQRLAVLKSPEALERVMRLSREQDRRVARVARDSLARLQEEQAAAEEARREREQICAALEALAAAETVHEAEQLRLQNRWNAVAGPIEPELLQRYQAALAACLERAAQAAVVAAEEPQPAEPAPGAADDDLDALLEELHRQPTPTAELLARVRAELERHEAVAAAERRPQLVLLRDYTVAAAAYLQHATELEALIGSPSAGTEPSLQELERLAGRLQSVLAAVPWRLALPPPAILQEARALAEKTAAELERVKALQRQVERELEQTLAALSASLDGGHLRESQRLLARAQRLLERLSGGAHRRFERRLKRAAARVRELQDWRRFATVPKLQSLCEQMEALVEADLPAPELAVRIQRLREEWRATGGSAVAPEGQRLWERFRAAGEQASARCRDYFAEQAQLRQRNLELRRQIVEQLDQFVAQADWPRLELDGLEAIRSRARAEWQAAVPVDRRAGRELESRFEALMEALTEQIRAKQQQSRERKEAIVERARQLLELEDARAAAEQAKALQAEWQAAGRAQPSVERRLWREFRRLCDQVFARRDAARSQVQQEVATRLQAAEALCAQAEALLREAMVEPEELTERLAALRQELEALRPLPRAPAGQFNRRLRAVERALTERQRRARLDRERQAMAAAYARAALCAELEQAALAGGAVAPEDWQQRWQAQAEVSGELQARLESRWRRALAAASGERAFSDDELAANLDARWDLCLWMEILAGVESPPAEQERRLSVQVQRLANGLAMGGQLTPADQVRAIEAEWLAAGPMPPTEQAAALAARFEAAHAAARERHF